MLLTQGYCGLRGKISDSEKVILEIVFTISVILLWAFAWWQKIIPQGILPAPWKVITSFKELHFHDALVRNAAYSIYLNFLGNIEAVAMALPLGFAIGLSSRLRAMTERLLDSTRYLPLSTLTGLFISICGIGTQFRVQFLAFGIFVYLLPAVVKRIDGVEEVYLQTIQTLGASKWQAIRRVYLPAVLAKVSDDLPILLPISWTYIIMAELINANAGGIGALTYVAGRASRSDKVYALLIVIVLIAFVQNKIFSLIDRKFFKFKYQSER